MFVKRNGIKKVIFCACFSMSMMMFSTTVEAQTRLYTSTSDKREEASFEYYEGKVTSGVNIRVDAGADKDKVMVDGKGVALSKGTIVTIIGSKKVGNKPWYKIRFIYGDKELEGFATSTYIQKTGVVITPTPMPTPTIEPTPEPTLEPELTPEAVMVNPTVAPVEETQTDSEIQGNKSVVKYIGYGIVLMAVAAGAIYFYLRKKNEGKQTLQESEKLEKQKEVAITSKRGNISVAGDTESSLEDIKLEVGRVSKRDRILRQTNLAGHKSEVYVIKSNEDEESDKLGLAATLEAIDIKEYQANKQNSSIQQENSEKKALRTAINNLKQHDIIFHKFFGKGEVYDNSDVRLIEVRFGGDARFLNKEQLVNKKLIRITNEKAQ